MFAYTFDPFGCFMLYVKFVSEADDMVEYFANFVSFKPVHTKIYTTEYCEYEVSSFGKG